jgi:hypothetical protein
VDASGVVAPGAVDPGVEAPVALRLCWHCSSAAPVRPVHSDAVPPADAPPGAAPDGLVPVVPPAVVPGAPPSVVVELLLVPPLPASELPPAPLLAPALEPDDPPAPPLPPALPCAHVALERPSMAAAMAAVSTLVFVMWNAL